MHGRAFYSVCCISQLYRFYLFQWSYYFVFQVFTQSFFPHIIFSGGRNTPRFLMWWWFRGKQLCPIRTFYCLHDRFRFGHGDWFLRDNPTAVAYIYHYVWPWYLLCRRSVCHFRIVKLYSHVLILNIFWVLLFICDIIYLCCFRSIRDEWIASGWLL